jgi:ribulose kinase
MQPARMMNAAAAAAAQKHVVSLPDWLTTRCCGSKHGRLALLTTKFNWQV